MNRNQKKLHKYGRTDARTGAPNSRQNLNFYGILDTCNLGQNPKLHDLLSDKMYLVTRL